MTLRSKLLLAQAPLVGALVITLISAVWTASELGRSSQTILRDNYRSVLATQRMKEAIERMDSAALFFVAGRREESRTQADANRRRFDEELGRQQGNITEPGEHEATGRLRALWEDYNRRFDRFASLNEPSAIREAYFKGLLPLFLEVKESAEAILAMNQDAMVRKSDRAKRAAERSTALLLAVSAGGCLLGFLASGSLTSRLLRPLSVLAAAARRIGEGDLAARARIEGGDEIAGLAGEFNTMIEKIERYRSSSLGELLEAQRASQASIDSLPEPVLVLAAGGALLHVNRAAEEWLGISVDAPEMARLDPAVRDVIDRVHLHVTSGKGAYVPGGMREAVRVTTRDGERSVLPRATAVYSEAGDVTGTTIILQDVTRLLRFEELSSDLVATVAHELRTPLTSLRMAVHLLMEQAVGPLTEKQADLVSAAREECERLQSLVDELLDMSRIDSGKIELHRSVTDAGSLLRSAVEAQAGAAGQRQMRLRMEIAAGADRLSVDADRLQLAFGNLIGNALRHSAPGGEVLVRAVGRGEKVRFEVIDTGPGIAHEHQQAIFEKSFQIPGDDSGGAGLGLYIAREIVRAHGGTIGVESAPGRGSVFWFEITKEGRKARRKV